MKHLCLSLISLLFCTFLIAQDSTKTLKKNKQFVNLKNRPNDHLMLQYGVEGWANAPDSAKTSGFSRHFNVYAMFDKPFKNNQRLSLGLGVGLGTSNMFFKNKYIDLKNTGTKLPFRDVAATNHYDKYKLTTIYLEAPIELRYVSNPASASKGFKAAIGFKVGTLLKAYTKGKNLVDANNTTVYGAKYIAKESEKRFISGTRIAATARVGYGIFSLHGSYQITNFLRDGAGADFRPYSVGVTISGL